MGAHRVKGTGCHPRRSDRKSCGEESEETESQRRRSPFGKKRKNLLQRRNRKNILKCVLCRKNRKKVSRRRFRGNKTSQRHRFPSKKKQKKLLRRIRKTRQSQRYRSPSKKKQKKLLRRRVRRNKKSYRHRSPSKKKRQNVLRRKARKNNKSQ